MYGTAMSSGNGGIFQSLVSSLSPVLQCPQLLRHFVSSLTKVPRLRVPPRAKAVPRGTAAALRRQTRRPRLARGTALKGGNGELRGKRPLYNHSNTRTLKLASLGVITLFVVGPQLFEVVSYTLLLLQS